MFEHHKKESPIISLLGMGCGVGSYAFIRRGVDGYEISRSLRFNSADSASLTRTPSSAGSRTTWTFSFWLKRSKLGTNQNLFGSSDDSQNTTALYITNTDVLVFYEYVSGSTVAQKSVTGLIRDPSAWYNIVTVWDTNNATANDRARIYINGNRVTDFSVNTNPSLGQLSRWNNSSVLHRISDTSGFNYLLDGYLADIHFIDGQALDPTSFGEFDTNGVWQPKVFGGEYGSNGFHLPFTDNSSASSLGTDDSGNGNDWTVNNIAITGGNGNYAPGITIGNFTLTDYNKNDVVDGNLSTFYADRPINGNGLNFSSIPQAQTSVRINYWTESGTVSTNAGTLSTGANTQAWRTISTTYPFTLTSFSVTGGSGGQGFFIYAIEVDGVVLVDNIFGSNNDSLVDSPTNGSQTDTGVGGEVVGNYATLNPLWNNGHILSNGNLNYAPPSPAAWTTVLATFGMPSGKWYWEQTYISGSANCMAGFGNVQSTLINYPTSPNSTGYDFVDGNIYGAGAGVPAGATLSAGDIMGISVDVDAGEAKFYKNGVLQTTLTHGITGTLFPLVSSYDGVGCVNFGQRPFAYTAPSGFKALCTTNLPTGSITTSCSFTGNANADGPFVYLNGVPTAMTINSNAVTFATHADKLSNGFKLRTSSGSYNTAGSNTYSITTTGAEFKFARAQPNP